MTIKNIFQIIFCLILFSCTSKLSEDLGEAMVGINEQEIEILMAERGK